MKVYLIGKEVCIVRIEQFEYLLAIEKYGTILAASQNLYVSPQAMSISITALEKELAMKLVNRSRKGSSLTANGKYIAEAAQDFIRRLNFCKMDTQVKALSGDYDIPVIHSFGALHNFFPKVEEHLAQTNPDFHLNMVGETYSQAMETVLLGMRPYTLLYQLCENGEFVNTFADHLSYTPLFSAKLYCTMPKKFPDAKDTQISIAKSSKYPLAIFSGELDTPFATLLERWHSEKYYIADLYHQSFIVEQQKAIDYIWVTEFQKFTPKKTVVYVPVTDNIGFTYGILKNKNMELSEQDANFLEYLLSFTKSFIYQAED